MIRDVNYYKFLKDAIVNKYRNAKALDFRTIEYDPWIYKWARDTFRELKTPEFLNIQNRDVLERLYERLHIDPRLKPLDDPDLALGNKDYQLSENFHQQHEADRLLAQQKVTATARPAPGGESAGTMASRGGQSTPASSHPPVIHNIPQISPTGIPPNLPRQVPTPEEGPATAKARRLDEVKAIQAKEAAAAKPDLKFKPGFTNTLRNFGSRMGTFFQRNVRKYLTMGRAATGIGAVIGGFAGAGLTGGSSVGILGGAVGGGILPSWLKSGGGGRFFGNLGNGAVNAFSRLSNQISGPRFLRGGASKRIVWVFLGMFLLFAIGAGIIGGLIGGTPSGEAGNVGIGTTAPITLPPPGGGAGGSETPTGPLDCPIPNGVISCGSQFTPSNGCGHCGIGYPASSVNAYCGYSGTRYAIDVEGNDLQPIILPKIGGNLVSWVYQGEERGSLEAIQKYTGSVNVGDFYQTYYLQFHHTQPGSGNPGAHPSGDIGGRICGGGCNERHVHIQIGSGGNNAGSTGWLDTAQYFCRQ